MFLVTLISDYGLKDYYAAALKAKVVYALKNSSVLDVTHCIDPYNVSDAVYNWLGIQKNLEGTVFHYIFVRADFHESANFLLLKYKQHYIFVADNGFTTLASHFVKFDKIYKIKNQKYSSTLEMYLDVTREIQQKKAMDSFASQIDLDQTEQLLNPRPIVTEDESGITNIKIIYKDSYGNVITNLSKQMFERARKDRRFVFYIGNQKITKLYKHFYDFSPDNMSANERSGDLLIMFNNLNMLQVSVFRSHPKIGTVDTFFRLRDDAGMKIIFKN